MAISETFASLLSLPTSSSILNTDTVIAVTVFITLLCACIVIGHLLEENRWANESITALLLGLATGLVVLLITKGQSSRLLVFSEDLFFIYLLPPIIFNAGFQVKKKQFFKNFSIILMFGICGTIISFCLISVGKGRENKHLSGNTLFLLYFSSIVARYFPEAMAGQLSFYMADHSFRPTGHPFCTGSGIFTTKQSRI